ncbi:MAG: hypothetical protein PHZ00_02710, partial [Candidatus Peribacteraceae bacterium]|nr:hypothetical protein [Candidatus Peribacteraceae bacterium]
PALSRLGLSFFVFGAVFLGLMIGVTALVSPDRFPVHLRDRTVRLADLTAEQEKLTQEHATLLAARATLEERVQAPVLRQVQSLRHGADPLGAALLAIDDVRTGLDAAISLPQVSFVAAAGTLKLGGEVRDPQGRSVQLLASFVDGLRALPLVASVTEPEYRVDPIPSGGTASPFILSITLHRGS